jgi:hypothetical protein
MRYSIPRLEGDKAELMPYTKPLNKGKVLGHFRFEQGETKRSKLSKFVRKLTGIYNLIIEFPSII